jgi:hypothetical protein
MLSASDVVKLRHNKNTDHEENELYTPEHAVTCHDRFSAAVSLSSAIYLRY